MELQPVLRPVPEPLGGQAGGPRILSVGDAARAIATTVRADELLRDLWIEGEVGRVTISSAGHAYFTLKDERAQLQCVSFRDDRVRSPFQPQTGIRVNVFRMTRRMSFGIATSTAGMSV